MARPTRLQTSPTDLLTHPVKALLIGPIAAFPLLSGWSDSTINDPAKFAYGANIGFINSRDANATADGAVIGEYVCSGFAWGANVGWVQLGDGTPANGIQYLNNSAADFGVNVQGHFVSAGVQQAKLRGFAYGANIGWINFEDGGNPLINLGTGRLSGFAWGANVGWINLGTFADSVRTDSLAPAVDSDGDGIADAFELQFTNPGTLTLLTATGDADGDGAFDVAEYLANTNPFAPDDVLKITALSANLDGSGFSLTWTSNPARRYRLLEDADLSLLPGFVTALDNIVPDVGATTTRIGPGAASPMRFFQVQSLRLLRP